MIEFACLNCGRSFKAPDHASGNEGECRECGEVYIVPKDTATFITASLAGTSKPKNEQLAKSNAPKPTTVHPNLQQETFRSQHVCGVTAIIFGSLALCVTWIPILGIIGLPFAALGVVFGVLSLLISTFRRHRGVVYGIVGSAISLLSVIVLYLTWHSKLMHLITWFTG